jgi:hypothetical protein
MLGRRFLILVAVLMGLTALAASIAPQPVTREERRESTPTPAPEGSPTFVTVQEDISTTDPRARVTVGEGDLLELTVSGPERDSVMLLGRLDTVDPTSPARFSVLATEPGEYPIELVEAGRQVGTLVVQAGD